MTWFVIAALSIAVLPADLVLAALFPTRIAPWVFVSLAFGMPALLCGIALSRT
jgi:hypothetical protein